MKQQLQINDAYIELINNHNRYLALKGGAGSGKSRFAAQKTILRLNTEPNHRFLAVRKVAATRFNSIFKEIKTTLDSFGILHEFDINKTDLSFHHKITGSEIITAGLDDPEKLKSISGITGIWIEEATELEEDDFDQLDLRLRGQTENYKQIILTFNPVDERHWIKKRFEDERPYNATLVKTTFEDNFYIDDEYRAVLEAKASVNPNYYRIYRLGEWGKAEVQRPYCENFNFDKHVNKEAKFHPDKPVYLSFDFNVEPFVCTARHIWFDSSGHHYHVFKEFVLNNGDVYKMAEVIKLYFGEIVLSRAIYTGDAMQRKREITQRENIDGWRILQKELRISDARMKVPRSNPNVSNNRYLINAVLSLHGDYKINPDCKLLINEMQFTEADAEGNIIKKTRDKLEQRADALDTERYSINAFMPDFISNPKKYGVKMIK